MARVLVIEDNTSNMELVTIMLENGGHTVFTAWDAEKGLELARTSQPDVILMDIHLPGMDGLEATARLKQDAATRTIPIIALTAMAMSGDEERVRLAGCDSYISKPLHYKTLWAAIEAWTDKEQPFE